MGRGIKKLQTRMSTMRNDSFLGIRRYKTRKARNPELAAAVGAALGVFSYWGYIKQQWKGFLVVLFVVVTNTFLLQFVPLSPFTAGHINLFYLMYLLIVIVFLTFIGVDNYLLAWEYNRNRYITTYSTPILNRSRQNKNAYRADDRLYNAKNKEQSNFNSTLQYFDLNKAIIISVLVAIVVAIPATYLSLQFYGGYLHGVAGVVVVFICAGGYLSSDMTVEPHIATAEKQEELDAWSYKRHGMSYKEYLHLQNEKEREEERLRNIAKLEKEIEAAKGAANIHANASAYGNVHKARADGRRAVNAYNKAAELEEKLYKERRKGEK